MVLEELEDPRGVGEDDVGVERGRAQTRDVVRLQHVVVVYQPPAVVAHGELGDAGDGVVQPRGQRGARIWPIRVQVHQLQTHRRPPFPPEHDERRLHQEPVPVNLPLEQVRLSEGLAARRRARL